MITKRLKEALDRRKYSIMMEVDGDWWTIHSEHELMDRLEEETGTVCLMKKDSFLQLYKTLRTLQRDDLMIDSLNEAVDLAKKNGQSTVSLEEAYKICLSKTKLFRKIFENDKFCEMTLKGMIKDELFDEYSPIGFIEREDIIIDDFEKA